MFNKFIMMMIIKLICKIASKQVLISLHEIVRLKPLTIGHKSHTINKRQPTGIARCLQQPQNNLFIVLFVIGNRVQIYCLGLKTEKTDQMAKDGGEKVERLLVEGVETGGGGDAAY
jgi:hypothetical protein